MVVGLPRSGTTLVYELLVQAFEVGFLTRLYSYTYGMPNLSTRFVAGKIRNPSARFASVYGHIPGRYAPAENAVFWDRWFANHKVMGHHVPEWTISDRAIMEAQIALSSMTSIAGRPYIFKNIYMTLSIPAFLRLVPSAKVIIVARDLEATIGSVYKGRQSHAGWWSIRPPFAGEVENRSTLDQTLFQCIRSQQLLDYSLRKISTDRFLMVDYAAVCTNPLGLVEDVARWTDGSLGRRDSQEIPDQFKISQGPALAGEVLASSGAYAESLNESRAQYLSRIESLLAEHHADVES